MQLEKNIYEALSRVEDPDLKKDLVTLNMIRNLVVKDHDISFDLVLTTPACPLKEFLKNECLKEIKKEIGDGYKIEINISSEVTSITQEKNDGLKGVKNIIAIASGKGGVGKSTISANLAVALAKEGAKVGLIDADIFGPSIPMMFGIEEKRPGIVKEDNRNLLIPLSNHGVRLISIGNLIPKDSAVVWRGPMASSALKQFFSDCKWEDLDYLLVDLPPGTSDIHLTLVQTVPVTGVVIVTTPQKVAIADASKAVAMFQQEKINVPILGLVENMAYFTAPEIPDKKYFIFGKDGGINLAKEKSIPFLGQIPIREEIMEKGDQGTPPSLADDPTGIEFRGLARNLAQRIAMRNAIQDETTPVEITRT
jgi:ATP-binding protein involved in chromosome partitioning